MKKSFLIIPLIFLFLTSCKMEPKVLLTPLEIQSMQTRSYQNPKKIVFPSVMSVLQDLGYSIKSADINTGLITAESTAKSNAAMKFWLGVAKVSQTTADSFIEEVNGKTKVRMNFINVTKKSTYYGRDDRADQQILEPQPYQNAFEKIENAIFIRAGS
jgi:hypothetical protein